MIDSPIFAHLASADLAQLGRIFGIAYVRFASSTNSRNELDASGESEAQCADMKREPNGTHACAAHATPAAREITADERVDYAAETGEPVRCATCSSEAKR